MADTVVESTEPVKGHGVKKMFLTFLVSTRNYLVLTRKYLVGTRKCVCVCVWCVCVCECICAILCVRMHLKFWLDDVVLANLPE